MARVQEATLEASDLPLDADGATVDGASRRRFTLAALIGLAAAAIPYLWVLWDGRIDPLHRHPSGFFTNFYDLQARALFHGHWDVPKGSLGIEGFVVDGKHYTYFPPFPSLLRMPILAVTDSLDGRLTAPSMLLAWVVTAVLSALLLWRLRLLLRGSAPLGRAEAVSAGVLLGTLMSGSVLLYLAALPWVYHEAFAWGAAMTVGALFSLLGVLERPSVGRVLATGGFTLGAVLSRTTIGWGCVIAVVLAAIWLGAGRAGAENRRWWLPVLVAGLIPLVIGCAVTWAKFGNLFMHPLNAQVWTRASAQRRRALAANGGSLLNVRFLPSTAWAYFRPDGLQLSRVYPFITLPATPPHAVGEVVIDQTYRTASLTASMPLLFLLGAWGAVTACLPRLPSRARIIWIPLVGAVAGIGGVLFYGYIAERYLGDFVPLLILAGGIGLIDLWRRLDGKSRRLRLGALAVVIALGIFGLVANLGVTTQTRHLAADGDRVRDYVQLQQSISDLTGHPLDDNVVRGTRLPKYAPSDQLYVVGDCSGLYISSGEHENPSWLPVEFGPGLRHTFDVTYHQVDRGEIPLVTVGDNPPVTVWMRDRPVLFTRWLSFRVDGQSRRDVFSHWESLKPDQTYRISVVTDTELHRVSVYVNGQQFLDGRLRGSGQAVPHVLQSEPGGPPLPVAVIERPVVEPDLCKGLPFVKAR
jgi:hypothetical protein